MSTDPHPMRVQREALCDLLESLSDEQWRAETLCEGWNAGHIAAHLLVREWEPVAAVGILAPPLAWLHDRRTNSRAQSTSRQDLISKLRSGPSPWMKAPLLRDVQVGEDWIHTEDIARGGASGVEGPKLPQRDGTEHPGIPERLWSAIGRFAPVTLRGVGVEGVVELTDGTTRRSYTVGDGLAKSAKGATADLTVTGPVGELTLFSVGRDAARVEFSGDDQLRDAVQGSSRSV